MHSDLWLFCGWATAGNAFQSWVCTRKGTRSCCESRDWIQHPVKLVNSLADQEILKINNTHSECHMNPFFSHRLPYFFFFFVSRYQFVITIHPSAINITFVTFTHCRPSLRVFLLWHVFLFSRWVTYTHPQSSIPHPVLIQCCPEIASRVDIRIQGFAVPKVSPKTHSSLATLSPVPFAIHWLCVSLTDRCRAA